MAWDSPVAMGVALRCRHLGGRLYRNGYTEAVLRAALLVDLLLAGRLAEDEATIAIDTDPTGFTPLDLLVDAIAQDSSRPLASWIGKGPAVQRALVRQLVVTGQLRRHPGDGLLSPVRRYLATDGDETWDETWDETPGEAAGQVPGQAAGRVAGQVERACIAALVRIAAVPGTPGGRPGPAALAACGAASWLVSAADDFIADSRDRSEVATAMSQGPSD